jgi:hypothetical protein
MRFSTLLVVVCGVRYERVAERAETDR